MTSELSREWMKEAACKGLSTRVFFYNVGRQPGLTGLAVALCNTCPVQMPCYCYALLRGEYGIWGGSTEDERARIRPLVTDQTLEAWYEIVSWNAG